MSTPDNRAAMDRLQAARAAYKATTIGSAEEIAALDALTQAIWEAQTPGITLSQREAVLHTALSTLITKADDLIAAIDGTTDQFELEVAALSAATSAAEQALGSKKGAAT